MLAFAHVPAKLEFTDTGYTGCDFSYRSQLDPTSANVTFHVRHAFNASRSTQPLLSLHPDAGLFR